MSQNLISPRAERIDIVSSSIYSGVWYDCCMEKPRNLPERSFPFVIFSCSEWEKLHEPSQSQGTNSWHSIHRCAAASRGQCATGNTQLQTHTHPHTQLRDRYWRFSYVWPPTNPFSVSGSHWDEGQRWKELTLHFRQTRCVLDSVTPNWSKEQNCWRTSSNYGPFIVPLGLALNSVDFKYIITTRYALLHVKRMCRNKLYDKHPHFGSTSQTLDTLAYSKLISRCNHLHVLYV